MMSSNNNLDIVRKLLQTVRMEQSDKEVSSLIEFLEKAIKANQWIFNSDDSNGDSDSASADDDSDKESNESDSSTGDYSNDSNVSDSTNVLTDDMKAISTVANDLLKLYYFPIFGAFVEIVHDEFHRVHINSYGLDGWNFDVRSDLEENEHVSKPSNVKLFGSLTIEDATDEKVTFLMEKLKSILIDSKESGADRHATNSSGGYQKTPTFLAAKLRCAMDVMKVEFDKIKIEKKDYFARGGATDVGLHTGIDNGSDLEENEHVSKPSNVKLFGSLTIEDATDEKVTFLMEELKSILIDSKKSGADRHATNSSGGYQKTPTFLAAKLRCAMDVMKVEFDKIKIEKKDYFARGGATDVGLHTGGNFKNTSWPLFELALKQKLKSESLHLKAMLSIYFYAADCVLSLGMNDSQNTLLQVLEMGRRVLDAINDLIYHFQDPDAQEEYQLLAKACFEKFRQIDDALKKFRDDHLEKKALDNVIDFQSEANSVIEPAGLDFTKVNRQIDMPDHVQDLDQVKKKAYRELVSIPAFDLEWNCGQVIQWIDQSPAYDFHVLGSIEMWFNRQSQFIFLQNDTFSENQVYQLIEILNKYKLASDNKQALSKANHRSKLLLVHWIATCIVYKTSCNLYPLVKDYSIPLNWKMLQNLVLDRKESIDAMLTISKYLAGLKNRPPLFHGSKQDGTIQFALDFANQDKAMFKYWNDYVYNCNVAAEKRFANVNRQKVELAKLRDEWNELDLKEDNCKIELNECDSYPDKYTDEWYKRNDIKSRLGSLQSQLRQKTDSINAKKRAPGQIYNELPIVQNDALPVIFFMKAPRLLRVFGSLCFSAQSCLGYSLSWRKEVPWDVDFVPWNIKLHAKAYSKPGSVGSNDIEAIHDKLNGVWYPTFKSMFTWETRNPFENNDEKISACFTDKLTDDTLGWMIKSPVFSTDSRGNIGLANQNSVFMNKRDHFMISRLRSFENQQIRKLCEILGLSTFVFSNIDAQTILLQTAFHVGTISDEGENFVLEWKTDLFDFVEEILKRLTALAIKLRETPRNHLNLVVLSQLSCFFSQVSTENRFTCQRSYFDAALNWARLIEIEIDPLNLGYDELQELYSRECLMYGYSLCCFESVERVDDVKKWISAIVKFNSGKLYAFKSHLKNQVGVVENISSNLIAACLPSLVSILNASSERNSILSVALQTIIKTRNLDDLKWTRIGATYSYESILCNDIHYSINLSSGLVLINGSPPCSLPFSIRNSSLFKSSFGNDDFMTCKEGNIYSTNEPIEGRRYEFGEVDTPEKVLIKEIDPSSQLSEFRLLSLSEFERMNNHLPVKLGSEGRYSYWLSKQTDIVVIRDRNYLKRSIYFLAIENNCYAVPYKEQDLSIDELVERSHLMDRFVVPTASSNIYSTLAKFEERKYIHFLQNHAGDRLFQLPRVSLNFILEIKNLRIKCLEHKGYQLASRQRFNDMFLQFDSYLVLTKPDIDTSLFETRILFVDSYLTTHIYDVNPNLNTLETSSNLSRFVLAEAFSKEGNVGDKRSGLSGLENAFQILSTCFSSSPYSLREIKELEKIAKKSFHHPKLRILCDELVWKSSRLQFLYDESTTAKDFAQSFDLEGSILKENLENQKKFVISPADDERINKSIRNCPISADCVKLYEKLLSRCLIPDLIESEFPEFPERLRSIEGAIGSEIVKDLEKSWKTHFSKPLFNLSDCISHFVDELKTYVTDHMKKLFSYIQDILTDKFSKIIWSFSMDSLINRPPFTKATLLRCLSNDSCIISICPFLSKETLKMVKSAIAIFFELQVFENKLSRIEILCKNTTQNAEKIGLEIENVRKWKVSDHIRWLIFEVEGCLQIRDNQYQLAMHLIENNGAISQLNMGLGKTRVILPMLILYWTDIKSDVVRVNVLSHLLDEAADYFQKYLSASILKVQIYQFPFHRNVAVNTRGLQMATQVLKECRSNGGILIMSPESHSSLTLKAREAQKNDPMIYKYYSALLGIIGGICIYDESDVIFHYRYQLIYSVGTANALDDGHLRWRACQIALGYLNSHNLIDPTVASIDPNQKPGYFQQICLKRARKQSDFEAFLRSIVDRFINQPPPGLEWITVLINEGDQDIKEKIAGFITDSESNSDDYFTSDQFSNRSHYLQLLAFRGLFSYGVMENALEKVYREQYGLSLERTKSLAVPYSSCDVPSKRSDFSMPDTAILLTTLSYYYRGLTKVEMDKTISLLFTLSIVGRESFYSSWIDSIRANWPREQLSSIDTVEKIDPSNLAQAELLFTVFGKCMETVNFFLDNLVFPKDTTQYSERLTANSWHLLDGTRHNGFSGTNDLTTWLLPHAVTQMEPDFATFTSTNGMMLSKIMNNTIDTWFLEKGGAKLIDLVASRPDVVALIDSGAILTESSPELFAKAIAEHSHFKEKNLEGVQYFDQLQNCWMLVDAKNIKTVPRNKSTISDSESFIIFDQSRTRGVDKKMKNDTVALLTVSMNTPKDSFMQGAGRLRQFGCNQKLILLANAEASEHIERHKDIQERIIGFIHLILKNTVVFIERGLHENALQGLFYHSTTQDHLNSFQMEDYSLETLYSRGIESVSVHDSIHQRLGNVDNRQNDLVQYIEKKVDSFGLEILCLSSNSNDNECEKEQEIEAEKVQEPEKQLEPLLPLPERYWDLESFILDKRIGWNFAKYTGIEIVSLRKLCLDNFASFVPNSAWEDIQVFGTRNYYSPAKIETVSPKVRGNYLGFVDVLLMFKNGSILLLSDKEADYALSVFWKYRDLPEMIDHVAIVNVSNMISYFEQLEENEPDNEAFDSNDNTLVTEPSGDDGSILDEPTLDLSTRDAIDEPALSLSWSTAFQTDAMERFIVAIMLFNGITVFKTDRQREIVDELVSIDRDSIYSFSEGRGSRSLVAKSDLEVIVNRVNGILG